MLSLLARMFLLRRLFGASQSSSRHGRRSGYGYGRSRGYGRGSRRGGGFSLFPFPSYSTRTRRGSRVSVGGCCLPIPLGLFALPLVGKALLSRRVA